MTIQISLLEDQFIDMAFITQLTQLTDNGFTSLLKTVSFQNQPNLVAAPAGGKVKWKPGYRRESKNHAARYLSLHITFLTGSLFIRSLRRFAAACHSVFRDNSP